MEVTNELFMNQPIPGESMTVKPGTYPYENPPLIDGPVEAMEYIMDVYLQIENQDMFLKMIDSGVPIEYLVSALLKFEYELSSEALYANCIKLSFASIN